MSKVKQFLVFIITLAIPHDTFKMKVTFCVKAVYTPVLAKHSKHLVLTDTVHERLPPERCNLLRGHSYATMRDGVPCSG